jgi:hypothetical protein
MMGAARRISVACYAGVMYVRRQGIRNQRHFAEKFRRCNQRRPRAHKTIRNIRSAWIKEQQVRLEQGKIVEYQVNMLVTFVLDE